jgi:hypothetical protein
MKCLQHPNIKILLINKCNKEEYIPIITDSKIIYNKIEFLYKRIYINKDVKYH